MSRRWPLILIAILGTTLLWWSSRGRAPVPVEKVGRVPSPDQNRPNVVLISLDTVRPDHLGCYGYGRPTSPHLDDLARESILFANCRTQAPWTLPSHMALLTSLLPSVNGVDNLNKVLPPEIPTLAEIVRSAGYRTAALVNNGQMRAHWGFKRGFDTWTEFEVDSPAGTCETITGQALTWLQTDSGRSPFFLFLHYYDAHDPYEAPDRYRQRLGTTLTGPEARQLCHGQRFPGQTFANPKTLDNLIAAYDAEIAWLDHEVGRLLAALPANTLVVLFSDHGEAFKEHGWMLHGATLFEEEIRTVLLLRPPGTSSKPKVVRDSVMLLDVAPTILGLCNIAAPVSFQGTDLRPLLEGREVRQRLIPSESKAVLEGRLVLAITLFPLKGMYSLFDGRFDLYRLPDEQTPLGEADKVAAAAVFGPLREWMAGEQFWMIHAAGTGDFEAEVELTDGRFGLFIPVGLDSLRDSFEVVDEGRALRWHVYPGGGLPKSLFVQPALPEAALRLDFKINGSRSRDMVYLGKDGRHPVALPTTVPADLAPVSPVIEKPFAAAQPGFYVARHRVPGTPGRTGKVETLDEQTIRQLRTLGYLP